jgi:monovalent cation/hydrogen antiporter
VVGLGLLVPTVMRRLGLAKHGTEESRREAKAEHEARQDVLNHARGLLDQLAVECRLSGDSLGELKALFDRRLQQGPPRAQNQSDALREIELRLRLIGAEREVLHNLLREGRLTDESRRRLERELDLEEAYLSMRTDSRPDLPM